MKKSDNQPIVPGGIDAYIAACPSSVQDKLAQIRTAIRSVAPDAIETVSYFQIPGYSYEGYDYNGMFAWFSLKEPYVRLHVRPPVVADHAKELAQYTTTASIISFPSKEDIPEALVQKLVKASLDVMKNGTA